MRKLYEIFKLLWIQKRIVAAAAIWGNTVYANFGYLEIPLKSFEILRYNNLQSVAISFLNTYYKMQKPNIMLELSNDMSFSVVIDS